MPVGYGLNNVRNGTEAASPLNVVSVSGGGSSEEK
jgi:hypothetical protein